MIIGSHALYVLYKVTVSQSTFSTLKTWLCINTYDMYATFVHIKSLMSVAYKGDKKGQTASSGQCVGP